MSVLRLSGTIRKVGNSFIFKHDQRRHVGITLCPLYSFSVQNNFLNKSVLFFFPAVFIKDFSWNDRYVIEL